MVLCHLFSWNWWFRFIASLFPLASRWTRCYWICRFFSSAWTVLLFIFLLVFIHWHQDLSKIVRIFFLFVSIVHASKIYSRKKTTHEDHSIPEALQYLIWFDFSVRQYLALKGEMNEPAHPPISEPYWNLKRRDIEVVAFRWRALIPPRAPRHPPSFLDHSWEERLLCHLRRAPHPSGVHSTFNQRDTY